MTLIKICGLTRAEDVELSEELGADFVGFVFVPESPRYVAPEVVPASRRAKRVGVFRDASIDEIRRTIDVARLDVVQVHFRGVVPMSSRASVEGPGWAGHDARSSRPAQPRSLDFARDDMGSAVALNVPVIHAFRVENALPKAETQADYVLFDTGGGTGRTFDWSLLDAYPRTKPFFLAGGITPDNIEAALRVRPDGIDLASGVERAPGIKDHDKLRALFSRIDR